MNVLENGKMMSPFFLLNFSDLDTASKWKGQIWLKILHSASLNQESDVPDNIRLLVEACCLSTVFVQILIQNYQYLHYRMLVHPV